MKEAVEMSSLNPLNESATYSKEEAIAEATRCLQCKKVPCKEGCSAGVDITGFLALIKNGDFAGAGMKIKEKQCASENCLPAGSNQCECEKKCIFAHKGKAINIYKLEKFVFEYGAQS